MAKLYTTLELQKLDILSSLFCLFFFKDSLGQRPEISPGKTSIYC